MKKRVLSLFMVLVLCLTLLPTAAFAEGEDMSLSSGETGGEGGGAAQQQHKNGENAYDAFHGKVLLKFFTACPAVISIEASVRVQNMTIAGTMVFLLPVTSFVFPSRSAADSPLKYAPRFLWRTS